MIFFVNPLQPGDSLLAGDTLEELSKDKRSQNRSVHFTSLVIELFMMCVEATNDKSMSGHYLNSIQLAFFQ